MRINRNGSSVSQVHENLKDNLEYIIALSKYSAGERDSYDYMQLILDANFYNSSFAHASAILRYAKRIAA